MDDVLNAFALLRRPPMVVFAISVFAILAGSTFIARPDVGTSGAFQDFTGLMLIMAGIVGVALIGIPHHRRQVARIALSVSGSTIVVGFALRGASLWQALAFNELGAAWSYYLVGGAQWLALAYMTMVAWFDVALPWVMARSR
jgi:hypothetical protein